MPEYYDPREKDIFEGTKALEDIFNEEQSQDESWDCSSDDENSWSSDWGGE